MKRLIYILLAILPVYLQSCVKGEDDIFSKSSSERMKEKLQEYSKILEDAEHGWRMEYYPETDQSLGGFNFFCTFKNGEVTMSGDFAFKIGGVVTDPAGKEVKSTYKLIADQGPVLSFNSYNSLLHFFSEPKGITDTDGYAGDYEFVFMRQEGNRLIMKGKKYGNAIVMTRIETSINEELKKILDMQQKLVKIPFEKIDIGGKQNELQLDFDNRQFTMKTSDEEPPLNLGIIFTDRGIKLYEPVTINGENVYEFVLNSQTKTLDAVDSKAKILRTPWIKILTNPTTIYIFDFNVEKNTANMNNELFSLIKEAYAQDKKMGELFLILYIGKNHLNNASGTTCMAFGSNTGTSFDYPSYACQFFASGDNKDLLNINIDYSKNVMMGYYKFFKPIADYIGQHSPYRLEDTDSNSPNSVKCISANDPNVWFELK